MNEYTTNKMLYTWELSGPNGASFILYPSPEHTQADIKAAKNEIRRNYDVVSLHVASEDDRDYLYKSAIFRIPETKPLRWYEIEQDEKLLRRERLKGTSPADFVNTYVLPFIEQTKAAFVAKFGKNILQEN